MSVILERRCFLGTNLAYEPASHLKAQLKAALWQGTSLAPVVPLADGIAWELPLLDALRPLDSYADELLLLVSVRKEAGEIAFPRQDAPADNGLH